MSPAPSKFQQLVILCQGKDCRKKGAKAIKRSVQSCLKELGEHKHTRVLRSECTGLCKQGPVMCVQPQNRWLMGATPKKATKALTTLLA